MNFLVEFYYQYPWLVYLQGAFTIWMLVDASRRRVEYHWYYIILFVPVLGPWAYFFIHLAPELSSGKATLFQRKVPLEELRFRAEQAPTLANHLELGERLIDMEDYGAALASLQAAHRLEPGHGQVQYCLAFCHLRLGKPDQAVPLLDNINRRDPRWSNYRAWILLVEVKQQLGNAEGTLTAARELVRLSPLLQHKCLLADVLLQQACGAEAKALLEESLQEHDYAPGPIRRRNRPWAREAKRLLKGCQRVPERPAAN
jgi:hypothetical protein